MDPQIGFQTVQQTGNRQFVYITCYSNATLRHCHGLKPNQTELNETKKTFGGTKHMRERNT